MYCKNCGRQLKEGTRFCDRCGQSVRKNNQNSQTTKRKEIEELKAERLNRKRRLQEKEAKQARNKKRRKSKGSVMIFIIVALLIAIVSVIIGYNMMAPNDNGLGTAPTSTNCNEYADRYSKQRIINIIAVKFSKQKRLFKNDNKRCDVRLSVYF